MLTLAITVEHRKFFGLVKRVEFVQQTVTGPAAALAVLTILNATKPAKYSINAVTAELLSDEVLRDEVQAAAFRKGL